MKTRSVVLGLAVLGVTAVTPARGAEKKVGPEMEIGLPGYECMQLMSLVQPLRATPGTVYVSDPVTLDWRVSYPPSCLGTWFEITGPNASGSVGHFGPKVVYPDNADAPYILWAHKDDYYREMSRTWIQVQPRPLPEVDGRPHVDITSNGQVALFVQAIGTPNAVIRIANDVQLDLSGRSDLTIAAGVQILGGRSSTERGAKLYTRTFPRKLFVLGRYAHADGVRISGLRIEGAQTGIAADDTDASDGITVYASVNVDITNNEIYGWRGSAVNVLDSNAQGMQNRLPRVGAPDLYKVRVTDNFIHHNQRYRALGYGVSVDDGAYVLIARNVFDYNRHAIAAGGGTTNGYYAQGNLVLEHGGLNSPTLDVNTHMFDVHGTEDCLGFGLYCGFAGEQFWFLSNTMLYDAGTGIKIRGGPAYPSVAEYNVFSHTDEWGGYLDDGALAQTSPKLNFHGRENIFGRYLYQMLSSSLCDFNGDGAGDGFLASGATWWYYSTAAASWFYLRDSTKTISELTLGHFNDDPYCDVRDAGGTVHLTSPGPELHGRRLQHPNTSAVFLVLDGKRHLIPDGTTYSSLFRDASGIEIMDLSAIPDGGPLSDAKLGRTSAAADVFLIAGGTKHWVDSTDAMAFYNLDPDQVLLLPATALATLVRGGDLSVGPGGFARAIVPSVTGQFLTSATVELTAAGFGRTVTYTIDPSCTNIGLVRSQSPSAGTLATVGTKVALTVWRTLPWGCSEERP
jgi:hypothetical protein